MDQARENDPSFWAPGTAKLADIHQTGADIVLHPTPSSDPNDPLNWSTVRKIVNFTLVSLYVLLTFVQLDIGFTAWEAYQLELGFDYDLLNAATATNYGGLAIGCIFFVPLVHKYGRRPMYIFSTILQLVSCVWFAKIQNKGDLIGSNLLSGLGGAISETIVQVTIADLFFVHHHAAGNGWYLFATFTGAYLGPVASGYVVESQGWRWIWWWCVILFGINLILIIFFFEESKYVTVAKGHNTTTVIDAAEDSMVTTQLGQDKSVEPFEEDRPSSSIDTSIPLKSHKERLAFVTKTDADVVFNLYNPIVLLFTFPAIAYTAATYGSLLAWFAVLTTVQATYLYSDPWNFSAAGVGLMNLAPFIGTVLALFVGGYLNDKSILWMSRRNGGIYEPEMRLWMAIPMAFIAPAGILMLGLGLNYGSGWPLLAVGFGIYGFALIVAGDIALSYTMDCYHDIVGNALVGVVFTRNAISVVVLFALTPWIEGMGLRDMHILVAVLCFLFLLIPVPLIIWGKKSRLASAASYRRMALKQPTHRDVHHSE